MGHQEMKTALILFALLGLTLCLSATELSQEENRVEEDEPSDEVESFEEDEAQEELDELTEDESDPEEQEEENNDVEELDESERAETQSKSPNHVTITVHHKRKDAA